MKFTPFEGRQMKSKTLDGECARFTVICYKEDVVLIEKTILSSVDLSKAGFKKVYQRSFGGRYIWHQVMGFKLNSLIALTRNVYDIMENKKK